MGISEQSTLLCEQKIVIQSSDFPVRRTGSHTVTKKHWLYLLRIIYAYRCMQTNGPPQYACLPEFYKFW